MAAGKLSAGLLLHREGADGVEVLIAHMGGPFWARKDAGAWSIPKGEHDEGADPLAAAEREFAEELGAPAPPAGERVDLGEVRQSGGKRVRVWAVRGDFDATSVVSNTFELEWPPRSGRRQAFPEVDRAGWFGLEEARGRLVRGQVAFLDRLTERLAE